MKFLLTFIVLCMPLFAAEKPNILMIISEDNSSHWIGCYAYSNAAVCAVARSTLLLGAYAPTVGTQHMRSRHAIPQKYRPNVEYLRAAGYYCANNSKTDYNFKGNDNSYWDQSSNKAHYNNRPEGKPFYAVFNIFETLQQNLWVNFGSGSFPSV
jgi:N-sulfoglucosamine sulfohydrolase